MGTVGGHGKCAGISQGGDVPCSPSKQTVPVEQRIYTPADNFFGHHKKFFVMKSGKRHIKLLPMVSSDA